MHGTCSEHTHNLDDWPRPSAKIFGGMQLLSIGLSLTGSHFALDPSRIWHVASAPADGPVPDRAPSHPLLEGKQSDKDKRCRLRIDL